MKGHGRKCYTIRQKNKKFKEMDRNKKKWGEIRGHGRNCPEGSYLRIQPYPKGSYLRIQPYPGGRYLRRNRRKYEEMRGNCMNLEEMRRNQKKWGEIRNDKK